MHFLKLNESSRYASVAEENQIASTTWLGKRPRCESLQSITVIFFTLRDEIAKILFASATRLCCFLKRSEFEFKSKPKHSSGKVEQRQKVKREFHGLEGNLLKQKFRAYQFRGKILSNSSLLPRKIAPPQGFLSARVIFEKTQWDLF